MKLSIAMIVKNEEKNLEKTLLALRKLDGKIQYEVVIVDTGSDDGTVDIARKFTDKIYFHKWENDFAKMRNISMEYCIGEWILVLDADEVLENAEELIKFLNRNDIGQYKSAIVGISNVLEEDCIYCKIVRLFKRKEGIKYEGIVHEQPVNFQPVLNTTIKFLHKGYSREDYDLMIYKFERNKELLVKQLENLEGVDRIYPLYQLAKTYSMGNKSDKGFEIMREAYELTINRKDGAINTYVIHSYAQLLFERKMYKEVIKVCEKGLKYSKNLDYYYLIAICSTEIKKYSMAEKYYDEYLMRREKFAEDEIEDVALIQWSYNKKEYLLRQKAFNFYLKGEYKKFIKVFNEIGDEKIKKQIEEIYLYCLIKESLYDLIYEYYLDKSIEDGDIERIVNAILKNKEEEKIDVNVLKENLVKLDYRLEIYILKILCNETIEEKQELDYKGYFSWKSQIIKSDVDNHETYMNYIKDLDFEDLERYIITISEDYMWLKILYEYSKGRFLCQDYKELNLVTIIEKVLIFSDSIEKDKYELLCFRAMINKLNLIKLMYNENILKNDSIRNLLNENERLILDLERLINIYSVNKIEYIRGLKTIIKKMPYYKKMVKMFLGKVKKNSISNEMIAEKENLCILIETYINEGKITEATEIVETLSELFEFDEKLINYKGIIYYINDDKENALLSFALASILKEKNFDSLYNIASILEIQGRIYDAIYYYKEAYKVCEDNEMKMNIEMMEILRNN